VKSFWVDCSESHRIRPKRERQGGWADTDYGHVGYQKSKTRGQLLSVAIHNRKIRVSVETTTLEDGVVWYTVRVDTGDHIWESDHRYSEFRKLHEELNAQNFLTPDIKIPPKTWSLHGTSPEIIAERTESLDTFLKKVVAIYEIHYCTTLINFLAVHPDHDVNTDIKDVNTAYEMGLTSFRLSKLLESRTDLRELLFPSLADLPSSSMELPTQTTLSEDSHTLSSPTTQIKHSNTLGDELSVLRERQKSCFEELVKQNEQTVVTQLSLSFQNNSSFAYIGEEEEVTSQLSDSDSRGRRGALSATVSDLSEFDEHLDERLPILETS